MLDFTQLARQMQGMSQYLSHEAKQAQLRLARATQLLNAAAQQQTHLMQLQTTWGDRLLFTAATPLESLQTNFSVSSAPTNHTVLATDGSQISPNHHEIAYCTYSILAGLPCTMAKIGCPCSTVSPKCSTAEKPSI
jgi:hypothetical protein